MTSDHGVGGSSPRYSIERELRRIWAARFGTVEQRRPMPVMQIIRALINSELLDPSLADAIREVYSGALQQFMKKNRPQLKLSLCAIFYLICCSLFDQSSDANTIMRFSPPQLFEPCRVGRRVLDGVLNVPV